ncbi:hypothetical protein [Noviherbaspirillum pedocola]|uniref:Uncharacterized protein n=1 Tax=Noviherbaspirillum pedocola TaxID=2801341 RepID=A0A934STV0_9BURK|nr:hypothetical protein [Noviherbaspirillum pedocola]MBK4735096.1 hypothetical protein [Noviherbaspirillum pedocola]
MFINRYPGLLRFAPDEAEEVIHVAPMLAPLFLPFALRVTAGAEHHASCSVLFYERTLVQKVDRELSKVARRKVPSAKKIVGLVPACRSAMRRRHLLHSALLLRRRTLL